MLRRPLSMRAAPWMVLATGCALIADVPGGGLRPDGGADGGTGASSGGGDAELVCGAGTKRCDGSCVGVDDPAFGCALEGCAPCSNQNATSACTDGMCVIQCVSGWADCDGDAGNGCEAEFGPVSTQPPYVIEAPFATPLIDGGSSDWPPSAWLPMLQSVPFKGVPSPGDLAARFRAAWDASALYVVAQVADDSLEAAGPPPDMTHLETIYEYDSVEVLIDGNHAPEANFAKCKLGSTTDNHQIFIRADGAWGSSCSAQGDGTMVVAIALQPRCYTIEAKIAWSFIKGNPPTVGAQYGFTIDVNDRDDGQRQHQLFWKFAKDWHSSSLEYGTLELKP